jgi:hypothetical protein
MHECGVREIKDLSTYSSKEARVEFDGEGRRECIVLLAFKLLVYTFPVAIQSFQLTLEAPC